MSDARANRPAGHHLEGLVVYLGTSVVVYFVVLIAFLGAAALPAYFREQYGVLHYMRLVADFEPIGLRGIYRGYGEYLWPQLPWLMTVLYLAWVLLGWTRRRAGLGAERARLDVRLFGVFAVVTLHGYVIYSVPDDTHIMQQLLLVAPLLFVLLYHLGRVLFRAQVLGWWQAALVAVTLLYASTLVFIPPRVAYTFGPGDWHNPRFRYLTYHPPWSSWSNPSNPRVSDRMLDRQFDDAARQIDALTQDGEHILVLAPQFLLYYASNTLPAIPRYGHLFYLLGHGRLEPAQFNELVPVAERKAMLERPPRVVVRVYGKERLLDALPELRRALASGNYRIVGRWGVLSIFLRDG